MSAIGFNDSKINKLENLNVSRFASEPVIKENEKVTVSALQLSENVEISNNTEKGHILGNLDLSEKKAEALPEIDIKVEGRITFYTNAYGQKITALKTEDGISYNTFSNQGLSIILKDNFQKRDVLVFSAMTDKVPKNSSIYDNYFHIDGKAADSKIYFDKQHNFVIQLNNNEKLVLDGKDGQTILEGPFKIDFNPDSAGQDFKVNYTGSDIVKKFTSRGGNIKF